MKRKHWANCFKIIVTCSKLNKKVLKKSITESLGIGRGKIDSHLFLLRNSYLMTTTVKNFTLENNMYNVT